LRTKNASEHPNTPAHPNLHDLQHFRARETELAWAGQGGTAWREKLLKPERTRRPRIHDGRMNDREENSGPSVGP
jgi:hypothetical protein